MNTININRKNITSEEIESYKNFQSLKESFSKIHKNTIPRNGRPITGIIGISALLIILLISVFLIKNIYNKSEANKDLIENPFINPPLAQCDIPFNSFLFLNTGDTLVLFPSGTLMELKKDCLIDSTGNIIKGTVEIRYREFMNPAEIFLSGIPMIYDSSGIDYTFKSAGMIEITAFYDNKPVQIAPEKPIIIATISNQTSNDYNLYYLDTIHKNWIYKGNDNMQLIRIYEQEISLIAPELLSDSTVDGYDNSVKLYEALDDNRKAVANIEQMKPLPPIISNAKKWHFTLDILASEFPELTEYKKTVFEIDESYKPLDASHPSITWDDVVIEKSSKPMYYYITFTKDTLVCKYLAYPVLTGQAYNQALQAYNSKFLKYQYKLNERKKEEERLLQEIKMNRDRYIADSISYSTERAILNSETRVFRGFNIMQFGIWNYDKVPSNNNLRTIKPVFTVNDTTYKNTVYLADISRNMLLTIPEGNSIKFDKSSKNILWAVVDKNHIAVFTQDDFKKIPSNSNYYLFNLRKINKPLENSEDFIELYKSDFKE